MQLAFKTNDPKKNIVGIEAIIFYREDINGCLEQMNIIFKGIEKLFTNVKNLGKQTYKAQYDKTGESTVTDMTYEFDSKDVIIIACQDWSKKIKFTDQLRVQIRDKDYGSFLFNEAY